MSIPEGDLAILRGILDALREDPDEPANWAALKDIGQDIGGEASRWLSLQDTVAHRAHMLHDAYKLAAPTREGRSRIEESNFHEGYAETGYSDPACGVIATGDWNSTDVWDYASRKRIKTDDSPEHFSETLEKMGVPIEWSDEWSTCDDCGKLVRTSPNSWDWHPSYVYGQDDDPDSGELICLQCRDRGAATAEPDEPDEPEPAQRDAEVIGTYYDGDALTTVSVIYDHGQDGWFVSETNDAMEEPYELGPYPNRYVAITFANQILQNEQPGA